MMNGELKIQEKNVQHHYKKIYFWYCENVIFFHLITHFQLQLVWRDIWKKNAFRGMGERLGWNYNKHKLDPWYWPFFEKS